MAGLSVGRRNEEGSLAIEMTIAAPLILMIFALIFAYGRASQVNGVLEAGTRDAARTASQARSYDAANERAQDAVREALAQAPEACQKSVKVTVPPDEFEPDSPLRVHAECTYGIDDLGLPGAPGSITVESEFISMIDPNRGLDQ